MHTSCKIVFFSECASHEIAVMTIFKMSWQKLERQRQRIHVGLYMWGGSVWRFSYDSEQSYFRLACVKFIRSCLGKMMSVTLIQMVWCAKMHSFTTHFSFILFLFPCRHYEWALPKGRYSAEMLVLILFWPLVCLNTQKVGTFLVTVGLPVTFEQIHFDPSDSKSIETFTQVALKQVLHRFLTASCHSEGHLPSSCIMFLARIAVTLISCQHMFMLSTECPVFFKWILLPSTSTQAFPHSIEAVRSRLGFFFWYTNLPQWAILVLLDFQLSSGCSVLWFDHHVSFDFLGSHFWLYLAYSGSATTSLLMSQQISSWLLSIVPMTMENLS